MLLASNCIPSTPTTTMNTNYKLKTKQKSINNKREENTYLSRDDSMVVGIHKQNSLE